MMTRQKLLITFFVEIGRSIANNANKPLYADCTTYLKTQFYIHSSRSPNAIEIFYLINSIHLNKSSKADNINPFFLRSGAVVLAPILTIYFQWSFDLGIFLQIFKSAKVIPIFKFGSRKILGNNRLITLFLNLSKILEKLIKTRFDNTGNTIFVVLITTYVFT